MVEKHKVLDKLYNEFLGIAFNTKPLNISNAKAAIIKFYTLFGFKEPEFIYIESPSKCVDYFNMGHTKYEPNTHTFIWGIDSLIKTIEMNIYAKDRDLVDLFLRGDNNQFNTLNAAISQNRWVIGNSLPNYYKYKPSGYGQHWIGDTMLARTAKHLGIDFDEKFKDQYNYLEQFNTEVKLQYNLKCIYNTLEEVVDNCFWFWSMNNSQMCIICERPTFTKYDKRGRLHNEKDAAVVFKDDTKVYIWNGIPVPEKMVLNPDSYSGEEILGLDNSEIRRTLIEIIGTENFMSKLENPGIVHIDVGGVLYKIDLPNDEPLVMVYVKDPSTNRYYFIRVPPNIRTVKEAVAWTFGIDETEYQPKAET